MTTQGIVIFIIVLFLIGIAYMIFSDEIDECYHIGHNTDKINGPLDAFYICLLYLCGIFILGDRIIKFLNKKFNKNYKEKDNNDDTIRVANIGKILAFLIISVIIIVGISIVTAIILDLAK